MLHLHPTHIVAALRRAPAGRASAGFPEVTRTQVGRGTGLPATSQRARQSLRGGLPAGPRPGAPSSGWTDTAWWPSARRRGKPLNTWSGWAHLPASLSPLASRLTRNQGAHHASPPLTRAGCSPPAGRDGRRRPGDDRLDRHRLPAGRPLQRMGIQIAGHLALPVSAAFFKLGYAWRSLAAQPT